MEDDSEDAEERYRRILAEQEAKNLGAVLGLAVGAAMVVNHEIEKAQQEEQQTMGGL